MPLNLNQPENLLDVLRYMVGPDDFDYLPPHQLSLQQKAAAFDILMDHYGRSRSGDAADRQQHILDHKKEREMHASFSSALLDGVAALKESVENRLICTVEIDFEWVKRRKPGQTHLHLVPAITWRLPQLLRDTFQVEKTFSDLEKGLAKALARLMNERANRGNYGPELSRKVCILIYCLL